MQPIVVLEKHYPIREPDPVLLLMIYFSISNVLFSINCCPNYTISNPGNIRGLTLPSIGNRNIIHVEIIADQLDSYNDRAHKGISNTTWNHKLQQKCSRQSLYHEQSLKAASNGGMLQDSP